MDEGRIGGGASVFSPANRLMVSALVLALACVAPDGLAKDLKKPTRVVTGKVLDRDDNPIESAAVIITDTSTGKKNATYTQKDGQYLFTGLEPTRTYEVQANYDGESSQIRRVTPVDPRDRIVLHLNIPPPAEEEGEE